MLEKDIKKVLISQEEIVKRSAELGRQITQDYEGKQVLAVALLRGAVPFLAELIKHIDLDIQYDFMDVTSYSGTDSTGEIKILKDLDTPIRGLDVLLVEDIVDTGRTLQAVRKLLLDRGAASFRMVALLDKPERRVVDIQADYVGFTVPDEFVVGFGLDYNQHFRSLPYIGVLKDECYK
ncbi:MAG: hypoxanthine phosphoribosyltransferase [Solobacterium sp.]|jgi:hypoxanthine phosphoribosyltransferase|nr:hypoxanthine phosphoribosyltransferase [Solobacterium sp.]